MEPPEPVSETEGVSSPGDRVEGAALAAGDLHPADVALIYPALDDGERDRLVDGFDAGETAALVSYLPANEMSDLIGRVPVGERAEVYDELPDDDLVDLLQALDAEAREGVMRLLPASKKAVARALMRYPEDTAGGRMTTALATVRPGWTIRKAIHALSEISEDTELLARIFVVDKEGKLLGKLRLRDLTFNKRSRFVHEIMDPDTTAVSADADQEEAVVLMSRYDLFAMPVVDAGGRLVGVITHDDAMEIQEEESTEDLERQSAIAGAPVDESYLDTSVGRHFRRRFGWVLVLGFLSILSGFVIFHYESVLESYFVLAIYMPMVVAAGGNTGGQAATMVIRAMSLGEFQPSAVLRVVWKEARVGLLMGSLLGLCIALQITFLMPVRSGLPEGISFVDIALTVGIALTVQIATSTLVGAALPIGAKAIRLDPAAVACPAITTIVDVTGLVIYFVLAKTILGL